MSNETEPEYIAGESWLDFLARRGIPRDKAESIHEIQWLRGERIRWMADAERLRMTEAERVSIQEVIDYLQPAGQRHQNRVAATLRGLLDRTK